MENGKEVYLTEKVIHIVFKLGIFKVKGEKPRAGYFEDNVMITESKQKQYSGNEPISAHHRDSLILAMIP